METIRPLWSSLYHLSNVVNKEWVIMGDFNSVLESDDKLNGLPISNAKTQDFGNLLDTTDLIKVRGIEAFYTWSNKRQGDDRIFNKIDRCICNAEWYAQHANITFGIKNQSISDHNPLMIYFNQSSQQGGKPFTFFNHLIDHPDFHEIVTVAWRKRGMTITLAEI